MCCCCVTLLLGRRELVKLTGDREPIADRSKDTTKIQLGEPMSLLGVTHKRRNNQKAAVSRSPQHGWQLMQPGRLTTQPAGSPAP